MFGSSGSCARCENARLAIDEISNQPAKCVQTIAACVAVVQAERPLGVGQRGAVPGRLELMSLVPFVERVDVYEEESVLAVRQPRIRLQVDGGFERLDDAAPARGFGGGAIRSA